ncbi:MAG: hypothetical protein JSR73_06420 [Proteobacteria bacterium]|nr:hypothetical protein [Pseudomonadota bacterium]
MAAIAPHVDATSYARAEYQWRLAFDRYLMLARSGASSVTLRAAAAAVHAAALEKGRYLPRADDAAV